MMNCKKDETKSYTQIIDLPFFVAMALLSRHLHYKVSKNLWIKNFHWKLLRHQNQHFKVWYHQRSISVGNQNTNQSWGSTSVLENRTWGIFFPWYYNLDIYNLQHSTYQSWNLVLWWTNTTWEWPEPYNTDKGHIWMFKIINWILS